MKVKEPTIGQIIEEAIDPNLVAHRSDCDCEKCEHYNWLAAIRKRYGWWQFMPDQKQPHTFKDYLRARNL